MVDCQQCGFNRVQAFLGSQGVGVGFGVFGWDEDCTFTFFRKVHADASAYQPSGGSRGRRSPAEDTTVVPQAQQEDRNTAIKSTPECPNSTPSRA